MQLQTMAWWPQSTHITLINYQWLKPTIITLFALTLVASTALHSAEQFTEAQCGQLSQALENNRDGQRSGYALRDSERIKEEELMLEKQLRTYCESPIKTEATPSYRNKSERSRAQTSSQSLAALAKRGEDLIQKFKKANAARHQKAQDQGKITAGSDRAGLRGTMSPQAQHRHFLASLVELRTPYDGVKQQAWLAWYQEPYWCYGVKVTKQIVACVDRRQQAQDQFEAWWQRQNLSDQ